MSSNFKVNRRKFSSQGDELSYVGFVIDDTGSMSNEIEAVKVWLTNCINGSYADCAVAPTGGWILSTFNDPCKYFPVAAVYSAKPGFGFYTM